MRNLNARQASLERVSLLKVDEYSDNEYRAFYLLII